MEFLERMAQRNADHYNDHPVRHLAIATAWMVGGVLVSRKLIHRLAEKELENRKDVFRRLHARPV